MTLKVWTASGSLYEFHEVDDQMLVRRTLGEDSEALRKDEEWLKVTVPFGIVGGMPMFLVLEPLGEGDLTSRTTSEVVEMKGSYFEVE